MTYSIYMNLNDIRVVPKDMPASVRAFVVNDPNVCGGYCILVNSRLSHEGQRKAVKHELDHIRRGEVGSLTYQEY